MGALSRFYPELGWWDGRELRIKAMHTRQRVACDVPKHRPNDSPTGMLRSDPELPPTPPPSLRIKSANGPHREALPVAPAAGGVRRVHEVPQAALPGVRDAVERRLSLCAVPDGAARGGEVGTACRGVDHGHHGHGHPSLCGRQDDGLGGCADRRTLLIRAPLSTTSVLDETTDAVAHVAAPWGGVLILTSIPYRFLQVLFIERLDALRDSATHYGRALG